VNIYLKHYKKMYAWIVYIYLTSKDKKRNSSNPLGLLEFQHKLGTLIGKILHFLIEDILELHLVIIKTKPVVLTNAIVNIV